MSLKSKSSTDNCKRLKLYEVGLIKPARRRSEPAASLISSSSSATQSFLFLIERRRFLKEKDLGASTACLAQVSLFFEARASLNRLAHLRLVRRVVFGESFPLSFALFLRFFQRFFDFLFRTAVGCFFLELAFSVRVEEVDDLLLFKRDIFSFLEQDAEELRFAGSVFHATSTFDFLDFFACFCLSPQRSKFFMLPKPLSKRLGFSSSVPTMISSIISSTTSASSSSSEKMVDSNSYAASGADFSLSGDSDRAFFSRGDAQ